MQLACRGLLAGLTLAILAGPALAQSLQLSPVLLEMPPGKRGAVLSIRNTSAVAVDVQVRPYDWKQEDGRDKLADSLTLQVGPSIVTIPAGETQTIRLLAPAGPRMSEGNWRVLVDQLPQFAPGGGLRIRLRLSIPVFAYSTKTAVADLRWRLVGGKLEVSNAGVRYARLGDIALRGASGGDMALPLGEMPYLLPGSRRHWNVGIVSASGLTVAGRDGNVSFAAPVTSE